MADNASQIEESSRKVDPAESKIADSAVEAFQQEVFKDLSSLGTVAKNSDSTPKTKAGSSEGILNGVADGVTRDKSGLLEKGGILPREGSGDKLPGRLENGDRGDRNTIGDLLNKKSDGVKELATGDFLVREDGRETLFTPSGDKVSVNPDGTFSVKGNVKSVETNKSGETTIRFGDGSQVTVDKQGILSVTRGNQSVHFGRMHERIKPSHDGSGDSSGRPLPYPLPRSGEGHTPGERKPIPLPEPNRGDRLPQTHPKPVPEDRIIIDERQRAIFDNLLPGLELKKK